MASLVLRGATRPVRSLGLVADTQYADKETWNARYYRHSLRKLAEAIDTFNELKLDRCVNLGDLVDGGWANFGPVLEPLARSRHRFHHVLGNHDFEVADAFKPSVPKRLGLKHRYGQVRLGEFVLVMLDTNDVSTYAHPEASSEAAEARAMLAQLKAAGALSAQSWNGAVGAEQLAWFERVCGQAGRAGRKVIVFAHHPVFPENVHSAWNAADLLRVLSRHRNVVAWFSGHNHHGAFGVYEGVPCVTLEGMVETADQNAFAVLHLYSDRFGFVGHGREPSRECLFRGRG